ncbi:BamA/TamA family outer membrane protein [Crocinitomix catalasitica]|nr:BamA/TamA family outer membrane protein [Crocinitomix catalasitica]
MHHHWPVYIFFGIGILLITGCRQAKYVSEDSYLLHKNVIEFRVEEKGVIDTSGSHDILNATEMHEFIRPVSNRHLRLWTFNRIDTVRNHHKVVKKTKKFADKNKNRAKKEDRINDERIAKARLKGKEYYKPKRIRQKTPRLGWREYVRTKWGEAPVELDTAKANKTASQLEIYLRKRGFRNGNVEHSIAYDEKKKKAVVSYLVTAGKPYLINAIHFDSINRNKQFMRLYDRMNGEEGFILEVGNPLDEDKLDEERSRFASYCRNNAYFGFNKKYINFEVDTSIGNQKAIIKILIKQKMIPLPSDSTKMAVLPHRSYRVKNVTYYLHNPDSLSFEKDYPDFLKRCRERGIQPRVNNVYSLLDTIRIKGKGTFIYNYKPFLKPDLLDAQNFLEITSKEIPRYYKEYYVERTYRTMNKLGVFATITADIKIDPENPVRDSVLVTYHLVPSKRQSFLLEPRTTNTNGVLGLSGAITYTNKNCFRGAQRLETSLIGGIEAQPSILRTDATTPLTPLDFINTFEIGPTLSFTFPKLVPMGKKLQSKLSKRLYPTTVYKSAVNIQRRAEFLRVKGTFSYNWNFKEGKTREWKVSLIDLSFISLSDDAAFQASLVSLNDLFLINSYSDHLTTSFGANWHFNNLHSNRRLKKQSKHIHDIDIKAMSSGIVLYATQIGKNNLTTADSLRSIGPVPFTTFLKFDIQYIINQHLSRKAKLAYRIIAGSGHPYLNSPSLPYEFSFFAGGSNDIRAFPAKTMAPGGTQKYLDTNLTLTQIGDMRLEANIEYRYKVTSLIELGFFIDAGNIWLIKPKGGPKDFAAFRWDGFYRQIAIGAGIGLRADLDFLVVRLDASWPIHNPYLPAGEKWIFDQVKDDFNGYLSDAGIAWPKPHKVNFSFGIGYPF